VELPTVVLTAADGYTESLGARAVAELESVPLTVHGGCSVLPADGAAQTRTVPVIAVRQCSHPDSLLELELQLQELVDAPIPRRPLPASLSSTAFPPARG
jgi:hypothetical protein